MSKVSLLHTGIDMIDYIYRVYPDEVWTPQLMFDYILKLQDYENKVFR